jgi:hypothetical protein
MKTVDFLDEIKRAYNLTSDYQLGKLTGWEHSSVSNYRMGRSRLDEDRCLEVAHFLHVDPQYVLACVAAERTKSAAARQTWLEIAERVKHQAAKVAGVACVSAFLFASGINGLAPVSGNGDAPSVYIMSDELKRRREARKARRAAASARQAGQSDLFGLALAA